MDGYKLVINDTGIVVKLNSNYTITSETMIKTEDFIYDGSPIVLTETPNLNMLFVFDGASIQFVTDDFTLSVNTITLTSPIVEVGDKIRITYTY